MRERPIVSLRWAISERIWAMFEYCNLWSKPFERARTQTDPQAARRSRSFADCRSIAVTIGFLLPLVACCTLPPALSGRQPLLALPSGGIASQQPSQEVPPFGPHGEHPTPQEGTPPLTKKQKQGIVKSNFEKMKRDADELAALAKTLQEDLNKSNENVFSLRIVDRVEKIEKLAKKIRNEAKGE